MASFLTHGAVGLALGGSLARRRFTWRYWLMVVGLPLLPDLDVGLMTFGIPYEHMLGHRGLMHSLPFAAAVGLGVVTWVFRDIRPWTRPWWAWGGFFFLLLATHGLTDAMTDGGHGVAFLAPFSGRRFFLPDSCIVLVVAPFDWRLLVGPHGISPWAIQMVRSEMIYVWAPVAAACAIILAARLVWRQRKIAAPVDAARQVVGG